MADHEDEQSILLPCAICARTFKPLSLEKHIKVCERAAIKKRKPFDSSKQRILGTELENFLPHLTKKSNYHEEKINPRTSWKKTHDEFLKTIRAAREDSMDVVPKRQTVTSNVSSGAPMRANEKGQCPTCYRLFGIKAYERHVAWCKERITRAPSSPATNVAKERLDARINYRAPSLKNRRMTNREKYAPGNINMTNATHKNNTSPPSIGIKGIKDNSLSINGNKHVDNPVIKSSAAAERRNGAGRGDGVIASGPLKSRLCDRSIKRVDNHDLTFPPLSSCLSQSQNNLYLPHELFNRHNHEYESTVTAPPSQSHSNTRKSKVRGSKKLRKHKNIVITRSQGNPKVNDVAVNDNEMGMTVKPCFNCNKEELITWKQICSDKVETQFDNENNENDGCIPSNNIKWNCNIEKLDQTYLINESIDTEIDNNTKVIYRSLIDPNLKILREKGINDVDEFPPSTPTEFGIDVTSASTPVLFDVNNSQRNDEFSMNHDDKLENKSTIDANDDSKQQDDTYVTENAIVSFDLNDTQKIVAETAEVYDNSLEYSMNSNDNNEIKINFALSPLISSVTIPQMSGAIHLIDKITAIDNFCPKSDTELSVTPSCDFTCDSLDSSRSNQILMKKRLRKKMNLLRDSTDFLISSIETNNEGVVNHRFISNSHSQMNESIDNINMVNQRNTHKYTMFPDILNNRRVENSHIVPEREMPYWKRMMKTSRKRFINNLNLLKNPKININSLPPLLSVERRNDIQDSSRPPWINYVRRHPDFNLVLTGRIGMCQDYDPFLIAERQLNELLSDTCSDQSYPDSPSSQYNKSTSPHYPLSQSSAFVKYPNALSLETPIEKRGSLIAPPCEFDDLSTGFSSDSTETNSITRELFTELESSNCRRENVTNKNKDNQPILGRRVIIDKSKALGCTNDNFNVNTQTKNTSKYKNHKTTTGKIISDNAPRPQVTRSNSVRAASASKNDEQNDSGLSHKMNSRSSSGSRFYNRNNNYGQNSGSNLSLSSIVSSDNEVKKSNFGLDDFMNSFDDSISYPSLKSFLKNDSLSTSSPIQVNRNDNGQVNDDDLSSPDSYKKQDHSKISVDSAYSSLNRKYSNHGLNNSDMANKRNEIATSRRNADNELTSTIKLKMSKFCHECGTKFPDTAKFCCECGVQRLTL